MTTNEPQPTPAMIWQPNCRLIAFPMINRIGKIRDVAVKLLDKPTEKSAAHYRTVVNESLETSLAKIGLPETAIAEEIEGFWQAVEREIIRKGYHAGSGRPTGGGCAE